MAGNRAQALRDRLAKRDRRALATSSGAGTAVSSVASLRERAGTWISDELALVSSDEIVERTRRLIDDTDDRLAPVGS